MNCAKGLLWWTGLMFLVFGAGFVLAPDTVFPLYTGAPLLTPGAATDIRAHNGGLGIGAGIWLLCCLKGHVRFGVLGIAILHAVMAAARLLGFALDGPPTFFMGFFLFVELGMAVVAGLVLNGMRAESTEGATRPLHEPEGSLNLQSF